MATIRTTDKGVYVAAVNKASSNDSVDAYTIGVSDPSNTCTWNSQTQTLTPNGSSNTGVVTLTATNNVDGTTTTETVNVVNTATDLEIVITPLS